MTKDVRTETNGKAGQKEQKEIEKQNGFMLFSFLIIYFVPSYVYIFFCKNNLKNKIRAVSIV